MNQERPSGAEKLKRCPACQREFTGGLAVCQFDGTLLISVMKDQFIGTKVADKYEVISEIGRGGMSIVYKARHELMDRTVAIKMLQAGLVNDQTSIKRFQQEAQAASCLTHPNVITVYDYGLVPSGQPYLVMDYLSGESLSDIVLRDGFVAPLRAITIFVQACDALEHAHQKGVLHRDLKCGNIMLTEIEGQKDVVKVVDFGIAKLMPSSGKQQQNLTQTGEVFGSPIYMSPEQCMGEQLDARSDIYSMGCMLYETLTGQPPLMGDTIIDTMQMHVTTQPPPFVKMRPGLNIPQALEDVCMKALEKKPADRFVSMAAFRDALINAAMRIGGQTEAEDESPRFSPRNTRQGILEPRVPPPNAAASAKHNALPNPFISNPQNAGGTFGVTGQNAGESAGSLFGDAPTTKPAPAARATGRNESIPKKIAEDDTRPAKRINANYTVNDSDRASELGAATSNQRALRKQGKNPIADVDVKKPGKREVRTDIREPKEPRNSRDKNRSKKENEFASVPSQSKVNKKGLIIIIAMIVIGVIIAAVFFFVGGNH
ncbi:MAG: serine/threonine-protein kinase [Candidatus Obscuribacterales bacterium]|nr:serine/threonine-protein kinase [Candidatus Obscuribacterales bacterium]